MNNTLRRISILAGILFAGTALAGYVRESFDGRANGTAVSSLTGWTASDPSVMVTNVSTVAHSGTNVLVVPIGQIVTNTVRVDAGVSNVVWTDFWTVPRPIGEMPDVDTNATAQFFLSNGFWVVFSGAGGSTTNAYTVTNLYNTSIVPVLNTGTNWYHVSVCQNYSNKLWHLFVDGAPIATNLGFINQSVSNYEWFAVQNRDSDSSSNMTLLDDVLITNAVPSSLIADSAGTPNNLRDAWELMYYGSLYSGLDGYSTTTNSDGYTSAELAALGFDPNGVNPSAVEYAFGTNNARILALGPTNGTSPDIKLDFVVGADRTNYVLGTATPNGSFAQVGFFYSGTGGNYSFVHPSAMTLGSRYFYKLRAVSPEGILSKTSDVTYAWYQQPRTQASTYYWVGIPVDYGASNKLDSTLGTHLARGLKANVSPLLADQLKVYSPAEKTFYLGAGGLWRQLSDDALASDAIPAGHGVLITRTAGSSTDGATNAVLSGVAMGNFTGTVSVASGWNFLCWPEDASNRVWNLNGHGNDSDPLLADRIWMPSRDGKPVKQLRRWETQGWQFEPKTGVNPSNDPVWAYMQAGEGFFYTNSGAAINWQP